MQEAPNSEFVSLSPADRTAIVRIRLYIVFGTDICIIFLFNEQTLFQCHIFAENYHFEGPRRMTSTSYIIFFCSLSFPGALANKALAVVESLEGKVDIFNSETLLI